MKIVGDYQIWLLDFILLMISKVKSTQIGEHDMVLGSSFEGLQNGLLKC
jgi:hypothetical protein